MPHDNIAADLVRGAEAIAKELGLPVDRVRYLIRTGQLPVGKEGPGRVVASKARLRQHYAQITGGEAA